MLPGRGHFGYARKEIKHMRSEVPRMRIMSQLTHLYGNNFFLSNDWIIFAPYTLTTPYCQRKSDDHNVVTAIWLDEKVKIITS